jgi:hypothetical protein
LKPAKLNGIDPQAYLTDVLTKPVNLRPASRLDKRMPWAWASRQQAAEQRDPDVKPQCGQKGAFFAVALRGPLPLA